LGPVTDRMSVAEKNHVEIAEFKAIKCNSEYYRPITGEVLI